MRRPVQGPANAELVLEALKASGKPMTAYEALEAVRKEGIRSPLTVYRALSLLIESKKVRRVQSIGAYIVCKYPTPDAAIVLAICDDCGSVEELPEDGALSSLKQEIDQIGFHVEQSVIEVKGRCGACFSETPT